LPSAQVSAGHGASPASRPGRGARPDRLIWVIGRLLTASGRSCRSCRSCRAAVLRPVRPGRSWRAIPAAAAAVPGTRAAAVPPLCRHRAGTCARGSVAGTRWTGRVVGVPRGELRL